MRARYPAKRFFLIGVLFAALLGGLPEPSRAYEQPRNTISIGIQGQYGLLWGEEVSPSTADPYNPDDPDEAKASWPYIADWGAGLALRLRYSTSRFTAIGLSFEDQRFQRRGGLGSEYPDEIRITYILGEYYLYVQRRKQLTYYGVLGAGLARPVVRFEEEVGSQELEENVFPGERLALLVGIGIERFITRKASIDVSLRNYGVYEDRVAGVFPSTVTHELALGIHYYTK
ncbi:MAG: hypothetical protein GF355_01020 [Candidatus Eisenbacteria bacterium]|nr:hypothetical protein [Candidatus Eisenbacteria bacterium]